jgi:D-alanyl-D-alanine carboxypeptidase
MAASRALRLTASVIAILLGGAAHAGSPALVVDVDSGRVLHAERATDPWFPASITKLMTTYVALDMVRSNRASMDQLLSVSEEAAKLPPSKMAFKPGTQIRLDNALKIIMVKSANDIAATIAENLGGSIEAYAGMMNDAAKRLGMRESRFVNPHGLPDDRQQTSARDMAILARALLREFPQYEWLFEIGAIQYGRRIMRNHNGLIGRYPGADGMKTGFICAAGFNVVASAKRDGRRLITVILGSSSANERTMTAADLFDRGFASQGSFFNPTLEALPASMQQAPPNMRAVICDRRGPVPDEDDGPATANADPATGEQGPSSSNVLAFAAGSTPETNRRTMLGPRQPVKPLRVWVGLNPPSDAELAAQAAAEEAADKARQAKVTRSKKAVAAKKETAKDIAADASKGAEGKNRRASLSLKPITGSTPDKAAKPAAKAAAAKAAPKKADAKPPAKKPDSGKAASSNKG